MMRNLIVLGCTGLLALGLAVSSFAGLPSDVDSDGVPDTSDNCTVVPNGPSLGTGQCVNQEDANNDGYGNPCDTDANDDGSTGLDDVFATLGQAKAGGTNGIYDYNCDGGAGLDDVFQALGDAKSGATPGPSGINP